jgi:hypothetical protein
MIRRFGGAGPPDKDLGASPLNSLNLTQQGIYEPQQDLAKTKLQHGAWSHWLVLAPLA